LPADMVVRAIGFTGTPLPGVPFDAEKGVIPSRDGRLLDAETGAPVEGAYVSGWAKTGAKGLIGEQRRDAHATAQTLLKDAAGRKGGAAKSPAGSVVDLLTQNGVRFVGKEDWKTLDR